MTLLPHRSRLALWLTLGLLADLALIFAFAWGDQVLLTQSLREAEPWVILVCTAAGFLAGLALHLRAVARRAAQGLPRGSRLRSALVLSFGGMVGIAIAMTGLRSIPLFGTWSEQTVVVLPGVIDGSRTGQQGCRHVMILAETPTAAFCVSPAQMQHALSWPDAESLELRLEGWGNRFGIFYTRVALLGPGPAPRG